MSGVDALFAFGKAFFVVMFAMNVAVILTWADRRYGALLQDRVGPERAVVWLPRRIAQALAFLPGLAVAGAVIGFVWTNKDDVSSKAGDAVLLSQGAIFMTWFTGLVIAGAVKRRGPRSAFDAFIRKIGDPRVFFYGGLIAHVGPLLLAGLLPGSSAGEKVFRIQYRGGGGLAPAAAVGKAARRGIQDTQERI